MKPIFTSRNILIMGILLIIGGLWLDGTLKAIWDYIFYGDPLSGQIKVTFGSALIALGPWILRASSLFGKGGS